MSREASSRRELLKQGTVLTGISWSLSLVASSSLGRQTSNDGVDNYVSQPPKADDIIQSQFAEFAKQAHADVHVEMVPDAQATKKLRAATDEGNPPDLAMFFDTDYFYYRSSGQLLEVTDLLNEMKKENQRSFSREPSKGSRRMTRHMAYPPGNDEPVADTLAKGSSGRGRTGVPKGHF